MQPRLSKEAHIIKANFFNRMNMRQKMYFIYFAAILIPFSVVGIIYAENTRSMIERQALEIMRSRTASYKINVNARLQTYNSLADLIANDSSFTRQLERPYTSILNALSLYQEIWAQYVANKQTWPALFNITIYSENETLHNSFPYLVRMDAYMSSLPEYTQISAMGVAGRWYGPRNTNGREYWNPVNAGLPPSRYRTFTYNRLITSPQNFALPIGILTIEISDSLLTELLQANMDSKVFILDWDKKCVASSGPKWRSDYEFLLDHKDEDDAVPLKLDGVSYYADTETLYCGWRIVTLMSLEQAFAATNVVRNYGGLLLLFISCLILPLIIFFSRQISKRQSALLAKMENFMKGDMVLGEPLGGTDEIGLLDKHFSSLSRELKQRIDESYALQYQKNMYHLQTLQMQINPHFLYNTLSTIAWLSDSSPREEIRTAVENFATFYRMMLSGGRDIIPLSRELDGLNAYLELQKIRYGGRISVFYQIDDRLYDCQIPKLTLQPLVENSIRHGLNGELERISIVITAREVDGLVEITIHDNGKGMTREMLEKVLVGEVESQSGGGLGFRNINDRIKLYFGKKYGLDARSEVGSGTLVILRMPFQITEEQQKPEGCNNENE